MSLLTASVLETVNAFLTHLYSSNSGAPLSDFPSPKLSTNSIYLVNMVLVIQSNEAPGANVL